MKIASIELCAKTFRWFLYYNAVIEIFCFLNQLFILILATVWHCFLPVGETRRCAWIKILDNTHKIRHKAQDVCISECGASSVSGAVLDGGNVMQQARYSTHVRFLYLRR